MNEKQIALYEYLIKQGDKYVPQAEVARELYRHFGNGECFLAPKEFHDTVEREHLTDTIREINISPEFEKIIISSNKGLKIATESEFDKYIKNQYSATLRKLSRIYKMAKKGSRDKQIDFGGHTVESFLENLPETT